MKKRQESWARSLDIFFEELFFRNFFLRFLPVRDWHSDAALECVGHAENAVPALHGEKTEWPHDIGTERRKRSVHDLTADAGQLNMAALARKPTSVRLYHT